MALSDIGSAPSQRAMGLGKIASAGLVFKRKFRWTMQIEYCLGGTPKRVPEEFVKIGSRPQIDFEETEINYLHGKMWIPGKATWQTMTVTYYDVGGTVTGLAGSASLTNIFGWIASVYDITNSTTLYMGSTLGDYEGEANIYLWDGCGNPIEGWALKNVWPQSVNFGELDMESSDFVTVELTLRYSNVNYASYCPSETPSRCPCTPCE